MSAQHLTPPHSAEKIEASHHTHSSEGHQVPGPPHSHGHHADDGHHHDTSSGKVVAVIALALLLGGAFAVGVRAPDGSAPGRGAGSAPRGAGVTGVVVLDDGRPERGVIRERERSWVVRGAGGEVVIPKSRVRFVHRGGTTLPAEYWKQYGGAAHRGGGGGIVVTHTGEVFVGRVTQDASGVIVAWPYRDKTFKGEITIPLDRVRWVDDENDTLTPEYWSTHGEQPIEGGHRPEQQEETTPRQPDTREREGAALPSTTRDRRNAAVLAQSESRWSDAASAWARVYADSRMAGDLKNLLTCTDRMLATGFDSDQPKMQRAQQLLSPLRTVPVVREALAKAYLNAVGYHVVRKQVADARRWALALEALGGEHAQSGKECLRAVAQVEHDIEEEEAEEHEEHGEHAKDPH